MMRKHASQWTIEMNQFVDTEVKQHFPSETESQEFARMLFGYGIADSDRINHILKPDSYSATLYYQGKINVNEVAFFNIPIPEVLTERKGGKKEGKIRMSVRGYLENWHCVQVLK